MTDPRLCPFCGSSRLRRLGSYPYRPWRCADCHQVFRVFRLYVPEPNHPQPDAGPGILPRGTKWVFLILLALIGGYLVWLGLLRQDFIPDPEQSGRVAEKSGRPAPNEEYMLQLINAERARAGVPPVVLGNNVAAQRHAESSLQNCLAGHWGIDGLKPYMRYSLAGGYQSNGENASGLDYCIKVYDGYMPLRSVNTELSEIMDGWMDSPGHRDTILDKWHKKVNIGLAWDRYNITAIQHFEGDYVEYTALPVIDGAILTLAGQTKNGILLGGDEDLGVQIYYDPPPHHLTRGQLSRTYCYNSGIPVAYLRPPLTPDQFYLEHELTESYRACPDPYSIPADAPPPNSPEEAGDFWQAAYDASQNPAERQLTVPFVTAREWTAHGAEFAVAADLQQVLQRHGPGVYTVVVWSWTGDEGAPISDYAIFYGIDPPDTYSPP